MAKKDKKKSQYNTMEESTGSKLVTALIVIVIVAIWLLIFGVLIKLDVGNFGSSVLTPVLKDVPVLNWILPDSGSDDSSQSGEYDNLKEANARIKELESQLATTSNSDNANSSQVQQLQSEVQRLKKFEDNQEAFAKRVKEFDENVVYNDKAPVCKQYQYSQEIKDQADTYAKMEPAKAAAILEEMTSDLKLVASILDNMQPAKSALILQSMTATTAAQVTTKMTSMKK